MDGQGQDRRNPDATCFVGGLDERVDDEILWSCLIRWACGFRLRPEGQADREASGVRLCGVP